MTLAYGILSHMPQTASAKKALRVSERRRVINDRWQTKLHRIERKLQKALQDQKSDDAAKLFVEFQSTVDRMARRHILHRNTAARKKARAAARVASLHPTA